MLMYVIIFLMICIMFTILYYNLRTISRVTVIDKLKMHRAYKFLIVFLILCLLLIFYNVVNFVIIIIHLSVFLGLSTLLLFLFRKIFKKEFKTNNIKVILGVIITVIYLGIGTYLNYHIFETKYEIYNDKGVNLRIIQIADSHVGTTFDGNGFYKEMEKLSKIDTDLFVVTGDFVDDDTTREDMIRSCEALGLLKPKYGVYFVYGNHDKVYYDRGAYTLDELVNELKKNNVHILVDEVETFDNFYLIGREDRRFKRKSMNELVEGLDDRYKIVLNHQPNDYDNEKGKVDLVLSGHTHGGQMFPLAIVGILSGSNDSEYGLKTIDNTNFIVTSGISDWTIQFKTGTKSEYVIIDIKNK